MGSPDRQMPMMQRKARVVFVDEVPGNLDVVCCPVGSD